MGDRLLAINGQALLGLSRDDVVLLLKHAHDQVSLQIEYDVCHKGMIRHTVELGSYSSLSERGGNVSKHAPVKVSVQYTKRNR